jgi:hypothetical protein
MRRVGRSTGLFLGLGLILFPACSSHSGLLSQKESAQTSPLPFDNPSRSNGISPTQAFASTSVPAGTTVVIRLESSLSSLSAHAGDQFQAVLDEAIVVQGQPLVPGGTAITGKVLAARASERQAAGYLRLALATVVLNGRAVEVHSSSLFAKGGLRERAGSASSAQLPPSATADAKELRFSTGHLLTFRLIQPLPLQP